MSRKSITDRLRGFEDLKHTDENGVEYWLARELQPHFGYATWDKFEDAINRAKTSIETTGLDVGLVFREAANHYKTRNRYAEFERSQIDYEITRYGCYVLAQNGDPSKEAIAGAQAYFAIQTRKQEVTEARLEDLERLEARRKLSQTEKEFAAELFRRDVNGAGVAAIRARGDKVLFNGYTTDDMKKRLGVPGKRALADFLPTVTIKAKDLAAEITTFNAKKNELRGARAIDVEHRQNNAQVRQVLIERGIEPASLPREEDIKKLESRIKAEDRQLPKAVEKPLKIEGDFDDTMDKIVRRKD